MIKNDPFKTNQDVSKFILKGEKVYRLLDYIHDLNPEMDEGHESIPRQLYEYFTSLYKKYPNKFGLKRIDFRVYKLLFVGNQVTTFDVRDSKDIHDIEGFFRQWELAVIKDEGTISIYDKE